MEFNSDVFRLIVTWLNARDNRAFATTCKMMNEFYHQFLTSSVRAGVSYLYTRQVDSIKYVLDQFAKGEKVVTLNAYMSFGKTLVGYEIARAHLALHPNKIAIIKVPNTVAETWISEGLKHYPSEYKSTGAVARRKIIHDNAKQLAQRKHYRNTVKAANYAMLRGKIIVTTDVPDAALAPEISVIVVDEYHRYSGDIDEIKQYFPTIPILLMGATKASKVESDAKMTALSTADVVMPTITKTIIDNYSSVRTIVARIEKESCKHICVAADSKHDVENIILQVGNNKKCYNFSTRNPKTYAKYAQSGGVLVASTKVIAEGTNLNHCNLFIVVLTRNNPLSLKRVQQLTNRVIRQSSIYADVEVSYYVDHPVLFARAIMSTVLCAGYEIKCRNDHSVGALAHIKDRWQTLTDGELLLILCKSEEDDAFVDQSIISQAILGSAALSREELFRLILA